MNRRAFLYTLLVVAASARIFMQVAAMPPYAGLDEIQHVAHLAFVRQEHRSPTTRERSVPAYLDASISQRPDALPSFAQIGDRWPEVVHANPGLLTDRPLRAIRPYVSRNYEAQQPRLYYSVVAPLASRQSDVGELRGWRFVSCLLAIVVVLATAVAGESQFGEAGIAAAAFILVLPTWMTLLVRVANDGLACALVAAAFAVSVKVPRRPAMWLLEGVLWGAAFATKLYTWPLALVVAWLFWLQRAGRSRVFIFASCSAIAVGMTLIDLSQRSGNPLGVVAFDRPGSGSLDSGFNLSEIVRVTIASLAWTSGPHFNALTPLAIALYLGPVLLIGAIAIQRARVRLSIAVIALLAFAAAQAFNVISCVLARRAGNPVPVGGKEGWYWYLLAPIVVATIVPPLLARTRAAIVSIGVWLFAWDILITEGALFHDYAGATSPAHRGHLFRWGPMLPPFTADLSSVAVGPLVRGVTALRIVECAALVILFFQLRRSALTSVAQ